MTPFDLIVVGAGPAGSTTAYLLSKRGMKVLLMEKATFPREKVCGGMITLKTQQLLRRLFGEAFPPSFPSHRYRVFYKEKAVLSASSPYPFSLVRREEYDLLLLERAKEVGVRVMEGEEVVKVDPFKREVITARGRRFSAGAIIGADGVRSRVRKALIERGLIPPQEGAVALALQSFIGKGEDAPSLFFGLIPWGYGWVFPRGEGSVVGIMGLIPYGKGRYRSSPRELLGIVGADEASPAHAHLLPYGGFLPRPVWEGVFLVGDAAGLTDPITGEGIFYAHRSAELLSEALMGEFAEEVYCESLRRHIFPEIIWARRVRGTFFRLMDKGMGYPLLAVLMKGLGGWLREGVHRGWKSTPFGRWFIRDGCQIE